MSIIKSAAIILQQHISVLNMLDDGEYSQALDLLSGASVGAHTRHIIELFQCLMQGYAEGCVDYDLRQRNQQIQQNRILAMQCLQQLVEQVDRKDKTIQLAVLTVAEKVTCSSSYYRELYYNIEHCIHHQAIIKIGMLIFGKSNIPDDFGLAPSTLQYRKQCAP